MELEQRDAGSFRFDPDQQILELVWSDAELTDADVKRMLERFGEHAAAHEGSNLLVDVRRFRYAWGPEMDDWRDATVIPVYNDAGVRAFAFLLPEGAPTRPASRYGQARFDTAYFNSREAAQAWFRALT